MERVPVKSSNIKSIGYYEQAHVLEIEFHQGGIYRYSGVAAEVHQAMMKANSHGSYFHGHIRGKYPFVRVE